MKKIIAILCVAASSAYAGNSDIGSSTSLLKCRATESSVESAVIVNITSEAFTTGDYAGPAQVTIEGISQSYMNISTEKSMYIKLENNQENPAFIVPLKYEGDGKVYLYFNDAKGESARLVYESFAEQESKLAELICK